MTTKWKISQSPIAIYSKAAQLLRLCRCPHVSDKQRKSLYPVIILPVVTPPPNYWTYPTMECKCGYITCQ